MILNHQHRFVFFHVPKAAGSSIRDALAAADGSLSLHSPTKHRTPADFAKTWRGRLDPRLRRYVSFCFVRDPWERFGSLHRYLLTATSYPAPTDLNEFAAMLEAKTEWVMKLHSIRRQVEFAHGLSFVGRYESLAPDFGQICDRLGLQLALPHTNSSGDPVRYIDGMDSRSREIVARHFREDIQRFGY